VFDDAAKWRRRRSGCCDVMHRKAPPRASIARERAVAREGSWAATRRRKGRRYRDPGVVRIGQTGQDGCTVAAAGGGAGRHFPRSQCDLPGAPNWSIIPKRIDHASSGSAFLKPLWRRPCYRSCPVNGVWARRRRKTRGHRGHSLGQAVCSSRRHACAQTVGLSHGLR